MHRDRDRDIHCALNGVRADAHLVVLRFHVEPGGSHGYALHASRCAIASLAAIYAFTPAFAPFIPSMGFHHDFLYISALHGDAAVQKMCPDRSWASGISQRHLNAVVTLGICRRSDQGRKDDRYEIREII